MLADPSLGLHGQLGAKHTTRLQSVSLVVVVALIAIGLCPPDGRAQTDSCQMSTRAAGLVKLLDDATVKMLKAERQVDVPGKGGRTSVLDPTTGMPSPWGPHCSQYFRSVMRQVGAAQEWTDENASADQLVSRIRSDSSVSNSDWIPVTDKATVQDLANGGTIVVGVVPGHLGFVFPVPRTLDVTFFSGSGPFIRDGNEHPVDPQANGKLFPST